MCSYNKAFTFAFEKNYAFAFAFECDRKHSITTLIPLYSNSSPINIRRPQPTWNED